MNLVEKIKLKLEQAFPDAKIEVTDNSAGHESHNPKGAHIAVHIIYKGFEGKSLIEQHRMINDVLKEELENNIIHALQIKTQVT